MPRSFQFGLDARVPRLRLAPSVTAACLKTIATDSTSRREIPLRGYTPRGGIPTLHNRLAKEKEERQATDAASPTKCMPGVVWLALAGNASA